MSTWLLSKSRLIPLQEELDTRKEKSHSVQGWEEQDCLPQLSKITLTEWTSVAPVKTEGLQSLHTKVSRSLEGTRRMVYP